RAPAFCTIGGRLRGGARHFDHVLKLECLDTSRIEHLGLVFEVNLLHLGGQFFDFVHPFVKQFERTEHAAVRLHGGADGVADIGHRFARRTAFEFIDAIKRELDGRLGDFLVCMLLVEILVDNVHARGAAKHDEVEQRVGTQAVGSVHRYRGTFAHGIQAVDDAVFAVDTGNNLTVVVGGNPPHLIVNGGHDGDGILDGIDVGELDGNFADGRQALHDGVGAQVVELQHDVAAITTTAAFLDFLVHGTRYEVARGQVFQRGRIALHKAFAVFI